MSVKRYFASEHNGGSVVEHFAGSLVFYTDYIDLKAKADKLAEALKLVGEFRELTADEFSECRGLLKEERERLAEINGVFSSALAEYEEGK
jgi:hypothetical protein